MKFIDYLPFLDLCSGPGYANIGTNLGKWRGLLID